MLDDRNKTAYHEAGHAAIGFLNALAIKSVTIERKGNRFGWTALAWPIPRGDKEWDKRFVLFILAGRYAEEKKFGSDEMSKWTGHHDTLRAMEHLMGGNRSEDEAWSYIGNFWNTARDMVHNVDNWTLIDIIAKNLLGKRNKTLSGEELLNIIAQYREPKEQ